MKRGGGKKKRKREIPLLLIVKSLSKKSLSWNHSFMKKGRGEIKRKKKTAFSPSKPRVRRREKIEFSSQFDARKINSSTEERKREATMQSIAQKKFRKEGGRRSF